MSDLISRRALLKQIDIDSDGERGYYGDNWKFIDTIESMPSAEKTQLSEEDATSDSISRQDAIDIIQMNRDEEAKKSLSADAKHKSVIRSKHDAHVAFCDYLIEAVKELPSAEKTQLSEEDATSICKCPCEYREPCDYCHYDAYRRHGCPAEEGLKDERRNQQRKNT